MKDYLEKLHLPLSEQVWNDFSSIWDEEEVKRKTVLTSAGETEQHLYFVVQGVQRVFFADEKGREATLVLTYPHSYSGVVDSFLLQETSGYYFETLSASLLMKTNFKRFYELTEKHKELDAVIKKLSHYTLKGLLSRMAELQCFTSEEKFRNLIKRSPHILQHVPHKYLANYLGIDPTNFSKLINTVKL